jgi:Rho guanine nucleotide exchange factor 12
VRNLKIISRIFYKPLLMNAQVGSGELIKLIFANLDEILEIHVEMRKKMKESLDRWRRDPSLNGLYGDIGELMEEIFSGPNGEKMIKATSVFCQHQQHALDRLRQCYGRPKDDAFASFLVEAESNPLCRKLQLKDMIPMEMQRLVKYPMLLETIAKYTKDPSPEQTQLLNSVTSAKKILQAVNGAKRNAENYRRLDELQRRLDTSSIDRNDQFEAFFQNFDFTKHKLIYEGPLTWRISRTKMIDLHVVLLETLMVFLTKGDGSKLQLKIHEAGLTPLLKLQQMIIKDKANDKRAFSILNRKDFRIFEFVAATATERKTWHRLIEMQVQEIGPQNEDMIPEIHFDSNSSGSTPRPQSAFEDKKIERVHVVTHPRLVNANEITIQQPTVFEHAQPILTPTERLRRDDKLIVDALVDKQKILASFLGNEKDVNELEKMADSLSTLSVGDLKQKTSKELAMSAIVQGNRLLDIINKGMSVKKENGEKISSSESDSNLPSVPCYQLTTISAHLMNHLMALLQVIQDQQSEMSGIKQQLYHYKDLAENGPGDRTVSEETLTEPPSQPPPLPPKG